MTAPSACCTLLVTLVSTETTEGRGFTLTCHSYPGNWSPEYLSSGLVFLNACRSAGPRYQCIGVDSFAEMFLRANAGAFIGSLWEIRDDTAQRFATQLYTSLLAGQELGAAVTALRQNASQGDPTWLAYAVYGHPQAKMA